MTNHVFKSKNSPPAQAKDGRATHQTLTSELFFFYPFCSKLSKAKQSNLPNKGRVNSFPKKKKAVKSATAFNFFYYSLLFFSRVKRLKKKFGYFRKIVCMYIINVLYKGGGRGGGKGRGLSAKNKKKKEKKRERASGILF